MSSFQEILVQNDVGEHKSRPDEELKNWYKIGVKMIANVTECWYKSWN